MRRTAWMIVLLTSTLVRAQTPAGVDGIVAAGPLTVWVVCPARPQVDAAAATAWMHYNEQTPSSFGKAASDVGTNASDHGQTASDYKGNATSTNASNYGQDASSVGTNASNVGQNAGSYGQTAGSYGLSVSGLADGIAKNNGVVPDTRLLPVTHDARFDRFESMAASELDGISLRFVDVSVEDLALRLQQTSKADLPDLLMGRPIPSGARGLAMETLAVPARILQVEHGGDANKSDAVPQVAITRVAPHPAAAKAFVVWVSGGGRKSNTPVVTAAAQVGAAIGIQVTKAMAAARQGCEHICWGHRWGRWPIRRLRCIRRSWQG